MKKLSFLGYTIFIAALFAACNKKETLHTNETIRKYKLTYYRYWDRNYIPFKRNASLYVNKQNDSCLLILRNRKGDTILSHLDKGIFNVMMFEYKVHRNNWLVTKKDYGKTTYDGCTGMISNLNKDYFPLYEYFTIDTERKKLRKINLISKNEFFGKIAAKYKHLKNVSLIGLENTGIYVFKDTLKNQQLLYEIATDFHLENRNGKYVLNVEFKYCHLVQTFTNRISIQSASDKVGLGEKIFYGTGKWDYNHRYELSSQKYSTFKSHIKRYGNIPGFEVFKTEIILHDNKNNTTKIIKDFPKDSLFENEYFAFGKQKKHGKMYLGVTGMDHSIDYYYELDTINWKLIKLPEPFNSNGYY